MRHDDDVVVVQDGCIAEVRVVLAQAAFIQGFDDRLVVNDSQTGEVEQDGSWLHLRDLGVSNQASGFIVLWHVDGHKVSVSHRVSNAACPFDAV